MEKVILCLGFNKKAQKQFQELLENYLVIFEKTKKGVKNMLKKGRVNLVIVYYKDEKMLNWIDFVKHNLYHSKTEVWLYTEIKTGLIVPAYKVGLDDFIGQSWDKDIILQKLDKYLRQHKDTQEKKSKKIKLGSLIINQKKHKVTKKGKDLDLTRIEYELLNLLVSDKTKIFTRKEIYKAVWGDQVIVGDRTLDVHMNNLRKKIGKQIINTKKGIGFGINPEI